MRGGRNRGRLQLWMVLPYRKRGKLGAERAVAAAPGLGSRFPAGPRFPRGRRRGEGGTQEGEHGNGQGEAKGTGHHQHPAQCPALSSICIRSNSHIVTIHPKPATSHLSTPVLRSGYHQQKLHDPLSTSLPHSRLRE